MSTPEFTKRTPPGVKPVQRYTQPSVPASAAPIQRDRLSWHKFAPDAARYRTMPFRACGKSGLKLPAISLGAWETFGGYVGPEQARGCIFRAFNLGITHFDLANTYGSPPGRAEMMVGRALREMPRDEMVIATKAGLSMGSGRTRRGRRARVWSAGLEQSLQAARARLRGYFLLASA